ncbi:reverse transcriptase domain-containing protein [Tanacetum coccineum]
MYVDGGSSMEVLYEHCFNWLQPEIKSQMVSTTTSLTDFSGETIWPLGQLRLLVTIGEAEHSTKAWINFMIMRSLSPYNGMIGRPGIREIQAVPSTAHGMLKFPVNGGIVTIRSTILMPTECTTIAATPKDSEKRLKYMEKKDVEKMAFHTSHGVYCYIKMPFGLKNAGATYQRLVDKAFDRQIGRNMEIYVEDLVIKSHTETELLRDIEETFHRLQKINMKLTPQKYTFGATEGMFLGYMISPEGIKPCLDKTEAVLQLPSPRTIKEVQSLNGKLASLNRSLSKSAEKSLPLFKTLKKCIKSDIHWTPEVEQAFKQLKQHLVKLPMLVAPTPNEELIMYLSASYGAISTVLMTERDTIQTPVYFGQILADFLVEKPDDAPPEESMIETPQDPDETLLDDRKEARKLCIKARQYELLEGILYRRSFLKPWLRCVRPLQVDYVIQEIHEGSYDMHAGLQSMVAKAMRSGYCWPTMHRDARDMIRKCKGIDIAGPFPEVPGKVKFLIVAMDYLTKWIEAKAVETISGKLPDVLWAHRTMIKSSNNDTPFSLTYGTEAVIPVEIRMPTYRTAVGDAMHNDEKLRLNQDLLKERRERAAIHEAKAKLNMTKYYNARVRGVTFRPGDFLYRSNDASYAIDGGKLGSK